MSSLEDYNSLDDYNKYRATLAAATKRRATLAAATKRDYSRSSPAAGKRGSATAGIPTAVGKAIAPLPPFMKDICKEVWRTPYVGDAIDPILASRGEEFSSPTAALLAGIMMNPAAHLMFENLLDERWPEPANKNKKFGPKGEGYDEVVIGAGLTAAIYCAIRVQNGFPKPLVIDREKRVGGAFAVSKSPTFFLNSRNRPGAASVPGQPGALNIIPGSIVQPSDLGSEEYQTNSQLAVPIRTTLAMYADVYRLAEADQIEAGSYSSRVGHPRNHMLYLSDGQTVKAGRVIRATGLGAPRQLSFFESERVLTYFDFLRHLDRESFPLRGMKRVAVIGGGDGARTAIEALCGQGPRAGWSVASLDWPDRIDWYGTNARNRAGFENCNRSRYKGIARLLPRDNDDRNARVIPVTDQNGEARLVNSITPGYECVFVNETPYDHAIVCTGYEDDAKAAIFGDGFYVNDRQLGRTAYIDTYVQLGPTAQIPLSILESENFGRINENSAALFRYSQRTAVAAMELGAPASYF